jgi:hypothetical protein
MVTYPLVRLGQPKPAALVLDAAAQIKAAVEAKGREIAIKGALVGGAIGLVAGFFLSPVIRNMIKKA